MQEINLIGIISNGGTIPPILDSITITENGTYTPPSGVDGFNEVVADIPDPVLETLTITTSGTYTPPSGVDGFNEVIAHIPTPQDLYVNKAVSDLPKDIVSFDDGEPLPLTNLKANIKPVQDLHGYNYPWVGGEGKNKFDGDLPNIGTAIKYRAIYVGDGTFTMSSSCPYSTESNACNLFFLAGNVSDGASSTQNGVSASRTQTVISVDGYITVAYRNYNNVNPLDYNTQIELGSTATAFAPYSNICPIIGWSDCDINVANAITDPTVENTYTIDLGETRYGVDLDVINGIGREYKEYASYNGETLIGPWISDRDKYIEGTTPTIGAQVVDKGDITAFSTIPTSVKSLRGVNNVFADTGDILELSYFSKEV